MSPELKEIYNNTVEEINFNPEKSDFSGLKFVSSILLLYISFNSGDI